MVSTVTPPSSLPKDISRATCCVEGQAVFNCACTHTYAKRTKLPHVLLQEMLRRRRASGLGSLGTLSYITHNQMVCRLARAAATERDTESDDAKQETEHTEHESSNGHRLGGFVVRVVICAQLCTLARLDGGAGEATARPGGSGGSDRPGGPGGSSGSSRSGGPVGPAEPPEPAATSSSTSALATRTASAIAAVLAEASWLSTYTMYLESAPLIVLVSTASSMLPSAARRWSSL